MPITPLRQAPTSSSGRTGHPIGPAVRRRSPSDSNRRSLGARAARYRMVRFQQSEPPMKTVVRALLLVLVAVPCGAQEDARLDQVVQSYVHNKVFMGSVLVARGSDV